MCIRDRASTFLGDAVRNLPPKPNKKRRPASMLIVVWSDSWQCLPSEDAYLVSRHATQWWNTLKWFLYADFRIPSHQQAKNGRESASQLSSSTVASLGRRHPILKGRIHYALFQNELSFVIDEMPKKLPSKKANTLQRNSTEHRKLNREWSKNKARLDIYEGNEGFNNANR